MSMCVGVFHTLVSGKMIRLRTHPNTAVYFREHEAHTDTHIGLRVESTAPNDTPILCERQMLQIYICL